MSTNALNQLRDLARQDTALQLALEGAADAAELQSIAAQRGMDLSASEAEQWLSSQAALAAALSAEELDALAMGLSDPDQTADLLNDEQLSAINGGEALLSAPFSLGEAI
jgi:hypothetical protein